MAVPDEGRELSEPAPLEPLDGSSGKAGEAAAAPQESLNRPRGRGKGGRDGKGGRGGRGRRGGDGVAQWEYDPRQTSELEAIVFGGAPELLERKEKAAAEAQAAKEDSAVEAGSKIATEELPASKGRKRKSVKPLESVVESTTPSVWKDPDDALIQVDLGARPLTRKFKRSQDETQVSGEVYEQRLREQFHKLHGDVHWAEAKDPTEDAEEDSDEEVVIPSSSRHVVEAGPGGTLRAKEITVLGKKQVAVTPNDGSAKGPAGIRAVNFHPGSELMLTAGRDKTLRLFSIDGDENPKVASYHFEKFPILEAVFTPSGDQILLTGERSQMWGLDVQSGEPFHIRHLSAQANNKYYGLAVGPSPGDRPGLRAAKMYSVMGDAGGLLVCDVTSKQPVRTLQMRTPGIAAAFSAERDVLYSVDQESTIYEWDLGTGRCKQSLKDPWAVQISALAVSRVTQFAPTPMLAVGTSSGNMDLFDLGGPKIPSKPTKSIDNLVTRVTSLRFHHEGELLVGASVLKKDQLKLVHAATGTTYQNWPHFGLPLNNISAFDVSRRGGYLALGNERGRVLLFQLSHYEKERSR
mmetsp:Transcript_10488/g.23583  ORF Transcript_10488/g.23583 Transcript_10488/m.23583 type:complete len:578 (-) Transcript_10488:94-1827(-)